VHCCHSHLHCVTSSTGDKGALTTTERKLAPTAPSEQIHPQKEKANSRFTPRCPSVVL